MKLLGHGIDLVEVARVGRLLAEHADRFRERCFTPAELAYASGDARELEHLAARFAAKEAVLKALGTGLRDGIAWTDIEVVMEPSGRPGVMLHARARQLAEAAGIRGWSISLTHTREYAAASAIATGE